MEFSVLHPLALLLLLFVPLVIYISLKSLTGLSSFRQNAALVVRLVLLIALILALSELQVVRKSERLSVMFILDASQSIPPWVQDRAIEIIRREMKNMAAKRDEASLMLFGKDASLEFVGLSHVAGFTGIQSQIESDQTNIADAIKLAAAVLPEDGQRRIVLLSDGNETVGRALEEAESAKVAGLTIDTIPLTFTADKEVILEKLTAPSELSEQETYTINVVVSATTTTRATIRLFLNDVLVGQAAAMLSPGKNSFDFEIPGRYAEAGFHRFRATVESAEDAIAANNMAEAFSYVKGLPRILYAEGDLENQHFLRDALLRGIGTEKEKIHLIAGGPQLIPRDLVSLQGYDALIISNIPTGSPGQPLDEAQMRMIEQAVKEGGLGLIMIGGEYSFGAGGYRDTPLERVLPVDMDISHKKVTPNGALVLVMHSCEFSDGNRWAKQISKRAIETLSSGDYVGILYYGWQGGDRWLFPISPVANQNHLFGLIDSMEPGDMPSFAPTLEAAYKGLMNVQAGRRHIVILSDGDPSGPPQTLMSKIQASKISISTVAIQPHTGQEQRLMQYLAQYTGGKYYFVQNPDQLPEIFIKEALVAKRNLILEKLLQPAMAFQTEPLSGIGAREIPPIKGYVLTTAKTLAQVPLYCTPEEGQQDPLLAHWICGLGRSVAFTSDAKNRWGAQWVNWAKYDKFWTQLVRWALRKTQNNNFQIATAVQGDKGKIIIDALSETGELMNLLQMEVAVVKPSSQVQRQRLSQTSPGRYETEFQADEVGAYLVTVGYQEPGGAAKYLRTGLAVSYSAEYRSTKTNTHLLKRLADVSGGRYLEYLPMDLNGDEAISRQEWTGSAAEFQRLDTDLNGALAVAELGGRPNIFLHDRARGGRPHLLWPLLLWWIVLLFPLDVFLRRVLLDYRKVGQYLYRLLTLKPATQAASTPTMDRLAKRKEAVQESLHGRIKPLLNLKRLEKVGEQAQLEIDLQPKIPSAQSKVAAPIPEVPLIEQATPAASPKPKEAVAPKATETTTSPGQAKVSPPTQARVTPPASPPKSPPSAEGETFTSRLLQAKKRAWEKKKPPEGEG